MSNEVLSQNEIDALLSALSTGEMSAEDIKKETESKKVRVYDFKRALRFSKDQIRSLSRIHENFARILTNFFSGQLRTYVQISVASVDQLPYEEFIRSIPKMTILNVFEVPPLDGRVLMEMNPNIAYSMIDLLMGGTGSFINKVDNLTEIEKNLMRKLFEKAFENYQEAWGTITEIEPMLAEFEVNSQFLQMVTPNETVVVISMNTTIGEVSGMINLCIPHVVLEPIIPLLSVQYWMQTNHKELSESDKQLLEQSVKAAPLPVIAQLGATNITIEEFLHLNESDIIRLDQGISDPIQVMVEEKQKFQGQVGKLHQKIAVQLLHVAEGDEEND